MAWRFDYFIPVFEGGGIDIHQPGVEKAICSDIGFEFRSVLASTNSECFVHRSNSRPWELRFFDLHNFHIETFRPGFSPFLPNYLFSKPFGEWEVLVLFGNLSVFRLPVLDKVISSSVRLFRFFRSVRDRRFELRHH